jgi:hypothetical protein
LVNPGENCGKTHPKRSEKHCTGDPGPDMLRAYAPG